MNIHNHLNKMPLYSLASSLATHLISGLNLGENVNRGAALVSQTMAVAAKPALALIGIKMMADGVKSLVPPNQTTIRARRVGNDIQLYRERTSLSQKIKNVASKAIPAAFNIAIGYSIASDAVASLHESYQEIIGSIS